MTVGWKGLERTGVCVGWLVALDRVAGDMYTGSS